MNSFIEKNQDQIIKICERYHVQRLAIFGSAATRDFKATSDIDVAVLFNRQGYEGSFEQYMGLKEELERLFNLPVDLVVADKIRNPLFAREVEKTQEVIYAA